jgi:predicted phosphodiesterase
MKYTNKRIFRELKFVRSLIIFSLILPLFTVSSLQGQEKVKIAVWGDSRENLDGATERIASILLNDITDWDIQIHTGDFTNSGTKKDWERSLHYKGIKKLFVPGKILMCTSNHDVGSVDRKIVYDKYTAGILPVNTVDSTTHFYAYHRSNVNIVVCDAYLTDSLTMQNWLERTLQDVKQQDWLIGVWHNPSYGDLTYKKSYLQKSHPWLESLAKHGGDFVLNGHAHVYVRTKPLRPDGSIDEDNGIVHIINGTGGATWEDSVKQIAKIAFTPKTHSFPCITFLTFEKNTVHLQTIDARPESKLKVIDELMWTK